MSLKKRGFKGLRTSTGEITEKVTTKEAVAKTVTKLRKIIINGATHPTKWNNRMGSMYRPSIEELVCCLFHYLKELSFKISGDPSLSLGGLKVLYKVESPDSIDLYKLDSECMEYKCVGDQAADEGLSSDPSTDAEIYNRVLHLCCSFRCGLSHPQQRSVLAQRLGGILRSKNSSLQLIEVDYLIISQEKRISQLLCFYDFILSQVESEELRLLRLGSVVTFMKDASAGQRLLTLLKMEDLSNMALYFCIIQDVFLEFMEVFKIMSKPSSESCHEYMSGLGLVEKNSLSASENRYLFLYLSFIIARMPNISMYNTILPPNTNVLPVILVGFLITRYVGVVVPYGTFVGLTTDKETLEESTTRKNLSGTNWSAARSMILNRVKRNNSLTTQEVSEIKIAIPETSNRSGTLGTYLKTLIGVNIKEDDYFPEWINIMTDMNHREFKLKVTNFLTLTEDESNESIIIDDQFCLINPGSI